MKIKLKLSVEVRRSQPEPCKRPHADDPIAKAIDTLLQKYRHETFVTPEDVAEPVDTLAKAAGMAGISRASLARYRRVEREAPDLAEMKIKLKLSVEVRRSQPEPCKRPHADDPPEQLPSVTEAVVDLARGWDHDVRSPTVAARFGFSPVSPARHGDAGPGAP